MFERAPATFERIPSVGNERSDRLRSFYLGSFYLALLTLKIFRKSHL